MIMSNEQQQMPSVQYPDLACEGAVHVKTSEEVVFQQKKEARIAYQENRKVEMAMIKIGQRDASNSEITQVYVEASEYFIYEISPISASESLRIYIHTVEEQDTTGIIERYNDVLPYIGSARDDMDKALDRAAFKVSMANLISQALNGKVTQAQDGFKLLIEKTNKEYREQFYHRMRYLITALFVVLACISLSVNVYVADIWHIKNIQTLIYVATAGSMGGFISISRRLSETVFARDITYLVFILYALERMMLAIFAAVAIFFAIKCNLAFGFFNETGQNQMYGYIVFSIVAGFSETFLPNLLIKLENKP